MNWFLKQIFWKLDDRYDQVGNGLWFLPFKVIYALVIFQCCEASLRFREGTNFCNLLDRLNGDFWVHRSPSLKGLIFVRFLRFSLITLISYCVFHFNSPFLCVLDGNSFVMHFSLGPVVGVVAAFLLSFLETKLITWPRQLGVSSFHKSHYSNKPFFYSSSSSKILRKLKSINSLWRLWDYATKIVDGAFRHPWHPRLNFWRLS